MMTRGINTNVSYLVQLHRWNFILLFPALPNVLPVRAGTMKRRMNGRYQGPSLPDRLPLPGNNSIISDRRRNTGRRNSTGHH